MKVVFRRIGQRRYAVEVQRPPFPDLEMKPAPVARSILVERFISVGQADNQ